jgi:hypothetical protein
MAIGNARFQILITCFIVITLIIIILITAITSGNSGLSFDNRFTTKSASASSEEGGGGDSGSNQVEGEDQTEGEEQTGDQEQDEEEQDEEEQGGSEPEETTSPETDDKTEAYETDDAQQIPTPETSPLSPLAIAPTLTPTPGAPPTLALSPLSKSFGGPPPGAPPSLKLPSTPTLSLTPNLDIPVFCKTNPDLPQCQPKTLQVPSKPKICLLTPNLLQCQPTSTTKTANPKILACAFTNLPGCETFSNAPGLPATVPTPTPTPSSENTGVGQLRSKSNVGDLLASSSSELQNALPKSTITQKTPDTLFSGPKSAPGGTVALRDPALVPGPDEEGAGASDECVAIPQEECNFPYPISQDEICRNGKDDDLDGKVDETIYCSEVPGESKPRPPDGILTPIPGSPLGP